jgi:hypothetical protein
MKLRRTFPLALALGWLLVPATEASAATCIYSGGNLGSWHEPLNWDCGHVPTAGDTAAVPQFTEVSVAANASAGGVHLGGPASTLTFSGGATLAAGTLDAASATLKGNGTVTVAGAFHKGGINASETMFISDSVDLVLNGDSLMDAGVISVCQAGDPPSDPTLHINADFTIAPGVNTVPFGCNSSGARIRVGPTGHLVNATAGLTRSLIAIDNDGTITVQSGTLHLEGGTANAAGATSDGDYLADEGATLAFQGGSPPVIGAAGHLGGAGTIHVNTPDMDMVAGSVLDPAVLQLSGVLRLRGTAPVTLPDLDLTGGTIDSDRPVAVDDMDVTAGTLQRDFTLTVQPEGSFTKTTGGTLFVSNNGAFGSADLVLNADASLDDGQLCVTRTGTDPDLPGLHINQDFTIGSAAPSSAFQCGPQFDTLIHVNGPDGHLSRVGSGTTNFNDLDLAGGTLSVASGQTFVFANTYAQSAGVTEIASGGTLQAAPTLTGGVLRGGGQVTGNVTNSSGTVRPGSSPGTLTVTGNYSQGAAGTLELDVTGTAQGTQYDHLSVGGAATLDGTVAVVKSAFTPLVTDTFQFLSSASRSGTFDALVGSRLANGTGYTLEYPGSPNFGARLTVTGAPGSVGEPTLTGIDPDSLADDNAPKVQGTAPPGATVALYTTADCSGSAAGIRSAAAFASPGITASVPDGSTTHFHATATIGTDTSACSTSELTYVNADVAVDESTSQAVLDDIDFLSGNLTMADVDARPDLVVPNVTGISGNLIITDNDGVTVIDVSALTSVAGNLDISGNLSAGNLDLGALGSVAGDLSITDNSGADVINLAELASVAGDLTITGNGAGELVLGSLGDVSGDLTLESTGAGNLDVGGGEVSGNLDLDLTGYDTVTGATPAGNLNVETSRAEATMRAELPAGTFTGPVGFTLTRLDPAALPPESGATAGGGTAAVDPVAAYQFDFDVPTLNSDATLTFDVQLDGLDSATRSAFLAAVEAGTATLATRGDAPGGTYQAFPICSASQAPAAGGCVQVQKLDAAGQPTTGAPTAVRFTGVTGHFSRWAVAIVTPPAAPGPGPGPGPGGGPPAFGSSTLVSLSLVGKRIPAKGPVKVRVANANAFDVTGRLAGETANRRKVRVKLPAKTFRVAAGGRTTVPLKLPTRLRKLLRRERKLSLRFTATVRDPAGNRRTAKKRITVRL